MGVARFRSDASGGGSRGISSEVGTVASQRTREVGLLGPYGRPCDGGVGGRIAKEHKTLSLEIRWVGGEERRGRDVGEPSARRVTSDPRTVGSREIGRASVWVSRLREPVETLRAVRPPRRTPVGRGGGNSWGRVSSATSEGGEVSNPSPATPNESRSRARGSNGRQKRVSRTKKSWSRVSVA